MPSLIVVFLGEGSGVGAISTLLDWAKRTKDIEYSGQHCQCYRYISLSSALRDLYESMFKTFLRGIKTGYCIR